MPENTSSPSQKGRIFISYRRIDTSYAAGRIYDRLIDRFGEDAIFMDVDTIEGGTDFVKVLEDAVQSCDVLIALIGKQWLTIKDKDGKPRLDNPEDFVRIEIATALKRNIRVIPVLVDGVDMPQPTELPENLRALARRNALQVNHHSFNPDIYRLIEHTKSALDEAEESRVTKAQGLQVERKAAEKLAQEKTRLEAEELARQKSIEENAAREAAEKAKREEAERRAARKATLTKTLSKSFTALKSRLTQATPFFRIVGIVGIIIILFWSGSLVLPQLLSVIPTAKPSATITYTPSRVPPTKTLIPAAKTKAPTSTPIGGGDGQIIFLSGDYEKKQWNVFSIKANGTGLKQLTFKSADINHPVWSPTGEKIAFSMFENGFYQFYLMDPDGSELTRISKNAEKGYEDLSWAPDGRKLAFDSSTQGDIFTVNSDGSNEVQLTSDPGSDMYPAWSPDGKKIAFVSNRSGFSEVYVMNSDGTNQAPLTSFKSGVLGPRWSPDGKYIVFASIKDQELWEIYIMKYDGTNVVRLTNNDTWDLRPKFTPDGTKISWDSCCFNISLMNLDGSGVMKLYSEFEWDADWKP